MATYNGAQYLPAQLSSILSQLKEEDELIISDDGSTDGTLSILRAIDQENVTVYENHFKDPVRNFQFALKRTAKPIICFSDQDDIWLAGKRSVMVKHLAGETARLLVMNGEIIDENGKLSGGTTFEKWRTHQGFWNNLLRNTFMGSSMAFTADLKKWIVPFPANIAMHDWWIGLMAEKAGHVQWTDETTIQYRIHGNNTSLKGSSAAQKLKWRIQMYQSVRQRLHKMNHS
ncbi:MAG: glycosyltransferase family 2 protein [Owenweeksia sp.]